MPGFAVTDANRDCVIRLCRRLDGVPLAIELATRRLRAIPLEQLADRLEDRFRLLTGGRRAALPHHQTIRAATEWSYDLCSPAEQLLWARLTVFAGSFDTEAVEQVCAGGALDREDILATLIGLVDKSVVLRTNGLGAGGEGTRYLLLETIREFGAEKLAAPGEQAAPAELQTLRDRHIARYLAMATALADDPTAEDQLSRYRQLWTEQANLRAALDYALAAPGRQRDAARLANALSMYWQMASSPGEGRFWLGRVLPLFWGPSRERALALINAGYLASLQGETGDGIASLEKGLAVAEQLQDTGARARGYLYLSTALTFAGRHQEAAVAGVRAYEHALSAGDTSVLITLDAQAGSLHVAAGEVEEGLARCNRGLDRLGAGSEERWQQSYLLALKGFCLLLKGELAQSGQAFCTALEMKHEIGDTMGTSYALEGIAWLAVAERRYTRAAWLLGAADSLWQLVGSRLASSATTAGAARARPAGGARRAGRGTLPRAAPPGRQVRAGGHRPVRRGGRRRPAAAPEPSAAAPPERRPAGPPFGRDGRADQPRVGDRRAGGRGAVQPGDRRAAGHLQAHRGRAHRAHLRQARRLLPRPAGQLAQVRP